MTIDVILDPSKDVRGNCILGGVDPSPALETCKSVFDSPNEGGFCVLGPETFIPDCRHVFDKSSDGGCVFTDPNEILRRQGGGGGERHHGNLIYTPGADREEIRDETDYAELAALAIMAIQTYYDDDLWE